MKAPEQKTLEFEGMPPIDAHSRQYWAQAGDTLLRLVREVVQTSGDKQGAGFAQDLGVNATQFSEALKDAGKHFSVKWLVRVLKADREHRILKYLAGIMGFRLQPVTSFTKAQIAELVVASALRSGAAGRGILIDAFGPETDHVLAALDGSQP